MFIILLYLSLECGILIIMYSNYKIGADAIPAIAKRSATSTLISNYIIETVGIMNPKYICPNEKGISLYGETSDAAMNNEQQISDYEKSANFILSDYREILKSLNSDKFCHHFSTVDSKYLII